MILKACFYDSIHRTYDRAPQPTNQDHQIFHLQRIQICNLQKTLKEKKEAEKNMMLQKECLKVT